jgi:hypothetical protein
MTNAEQNKRLARAVADFMYYQAKATAALREVTAIGLLENEGNPLPCPIRGEDQLRFYSRLGGTTIEPGAFQDVIEDAEKAIDANGYIV